MLVGQRLLVEDAQHRVLAEDARHDRDAEVDLAAVLDATLKRPSCGTRRSAMSSSAITLMREIDLLGHVAAPGTRLIVRQHAVDAVLDRQAARGAFPGGCRSRRP